MRTAAGSRPASSAARRTVATHRSTVSSVKKVCSTTMSKARPASASVLGPKATSPSGMSSSKVASRWRIENCPAGPSWPKITSPCQRRRISPAKSSIWAVVIFGMP